MPDYPALAKQAGAISSGPASVDYNALAKQAGAISSKPKEGSIVGDVFEGIGSGVFQIPVGVYDTIRKIPGVAEYLLEPNAYVRSLTTAPNSTAGMFGRALEGAAEFLLPAGEVAKASKGMGLLRRAFNQAAVGSGVSAIQSSGDLGATATGAALGAGGELAGAMAGGVKNLLAGKAPTLANFAESFGGATPTQKARISKAIDVLSRDGVVPPDSVHEMQDLIKSRLKEIGQQYQSLDPAIAAREVDPAGVVAELRKAQQQYMRRGVVTDKAAHGAIEKQIKSLQQIAEQNGGKVNIEDIVHLKQNANGRTNFNSPDSDKSLWRSIGDAYRAAADAIAPEITPLNQDYQKYKDLEQIIDQNIARGKGTTPSGLDALLKRAAQHGTGAAAGGAIGGAVAGPVGAAVGSAVGGIVGPKLGKVAAQALQNAVDSGAFQSFAPAKQQLLRLASAVGDNATVLRLLGTSAIEEGVVSK